MLTLSFLFLVLLSSLRLYAVLSCNQLDRESLLSFYHQISSASATPLNWSSTDCCQWEGIACRTYDLRVTRLWLPQRGLAGTITPFLANLSHLSHLNLSCNHLSGPFPHTVFNTLNHLQTVDLSSNQFNGSIDSVFLHEALNLIAFNVSTNSFIGPIPSSVCKNSRFLEILDFSMNQFSGQQFDGLGHCSNLRVFRAGLNSLSGWLPPDLYSMRTLKEISLFNNHFSGTINSIIVLLSNLKILELHVNELSGELPLDIGLLSNLEHLQLHTNNLSGTLPPLMNCSKLEVLLLRNNHFGGEISILDFSKLRQLQVVDFANNSFALTAVRLASNRLVGEIPPCISSLTSLYHLALSDNYLSNVVGALKILEHCENLTVLFLSRCFHDERMPDDNDLLHLTGFQNLQILTLGGCKLHGEIPFWTSKLRKLKILNLSYNKISGSIPTWLGNMPSLFDLNLTQNSLSGNVPHEISRLPALIAENTSSELIPLKLPYVVRGLEYNRLFNVHRALKLGNNSLSGDIPGEIGQLKLLQLLDLSNNKFNGSIPDELSHLINLERLDLSSNNLSGEIPESFARLHFLSSFSVANKDLEGEIPRDGQFETFSVTSFQGNPKLCGSQGERSCSVGTRVDIYEEEETEESPWYTTVPSGLGYFVGFFVVTVSLLFGGFCRT
ncbi:Leucine-rich repeat protein [Handroanthus impetiginosus]|uniref:Leucine-rich repeat protein n=1 Tax=Handroanthus impetiginosus TaxID=429701 RepID=A0A2G9GC97_9LAMI|nr:Leucine-rich repeat protein [Handroanthus impetiginosus]